MTAKERLEQKVASLQQKHEQARASDRLQLEEDHVRELREARKEVEVLQFKLLQQEQLRSQGERARRKMYNTIQVG